MAVVRVQAKGQMTVPEAMRKAMGIETGTELVCVQTAPDAFECRVLSVPVGLRAYLDTHALSGPGTTQEEIDTAIEAGVLAEHSDLIHDLEAKAELAQRDAVPVCSANARDFPVTPNSYVTAVL